MIELVYGGSGSGKSEYAENRILQIAKKNSQKFYAATMIPFGKDAEERIARHRQLRSGKGFETVECPVDFGEVQLAVGEASNPSVLLECLGNLTANEMFRNNQLIDAETVARKILFDITRFIEQNKVENLVIVSNNVFEDGMEYDEGTLQYMKALAKINMELTSISEKVTEVVAGITVSLKG